MRCYRGRYATDVAVRRVQLLAVVSCSRSFGGTTGARLGYLCHTVFAASPVLPQRWAVTLRPGVFRLVDLPFQVVPKGHEKPGRCSAGKL